MRYWLLILILCLPACAGGGSLGFLPRGADPGLDRMLSASLYEIRETYVEEVDLAHLTASGLAGISQFDSSLSVAREGDYIILRQSEAELNRYPLPQSSRTGAWGQLAVALVSQAQERSHALARESEAEITDTVLHHLTAQLDSFSRYVTPREADEHRARRTGYGGIGLAFDLEEERIIIRRVFPDTPAARAGIREGDRITHIGGESVAGWVEETIRDRLRGPAGSNVILTLLRGEERKAQSYQAQLRRERVVPNMVSWWIKDEIGIIHIDTFNLTTARDVRDAIESMDKSTSSGMIGFVLDMRSNPGGLLDQAVDVADLFIRRGDLLTSSGRHPNSRQHYRANQRDYATDRPIAVLINGRSASAAEITAAALQDQGRAVLMGTTSYGKGTVQTVTELPNHGELLLTWSYFHAPSGYTIHRLGVVPQICSSGLQNLEDARRFLNEQNPPNMVELHRRQQLASIATLSGTQYGTPESAAYIQSLRDLCPADTQRRDLELDLALHLLKTPSLYSKWLNQPTR